MTSAVISSPWRISWRARDSSNSAAKFSTPGLDIAVCVAVAMRGWFLLHVPPRARTRYLAPRRAGCRHPQMARAGYGKRAPAALLRGARLTCPFDTDDGTQTRKGHAAPVASDGAGSLAMKGENGGGNLGNRQIGRIEDPRVRGWHERRRRSRRIPDVAFPDIAQKTFECNRDSFCDQLLMPTVRPLLGAGRQKHLQPGIRKNDRSHVPALGNQARGPAERALASEKGCAECRMNGDPGSGCGDRFGAQRIGNVAAVEHRAPAAERHVQAGGKIYQPGRIIGRNAVLERPQRDQAIE